MKKISIISLLIFIVACGGKKIQIIEPVMAEYNCNVIVTENYAYFMRSGEPVRQLEKINNCLYGDIKEQESHSRYFEIKTNGTAAIFGSDIRHGCRIVGDNPFTECK